MAKLYFKTGVMGSSKSLDMIRSNYNYIERGMKTLIFKPSVDTRSGTDECWITSRTGMRVKGQWISTETNLFTFIKDLSRENKYAAVFIDEVQFLTEKQIEELQDIVYELNIPVLAYGLKTDFRGYLFPGVARLLALADDVQEIRSICWCGNRATQNVRIIDNKVVKDGDIIQIGGEGSYSALCNKHFRRGILN
ncbi:MAG: thymidine kinase [Romboutsia sp.]